MAVSSLIASAVVTAAAASPGGVCPNPKHDCYTTGGPGCSDIECCSMICPGDSFCCSVAWDGICIQMAIELCGKCVARCGDGTPEGERCGEHINDGCFDASIGADCCGVFSLGCSDPACGLLVCSYLPYCCDQSWNVDCSVYAQLLCPACVQPTYAFGSIGCGESVCGTIGTDGSIADQDWFAFEVGPGPLNVTVSINATFPAHVHLRRIDDCFNPLTLADIVSACDASLSVCLEPGSYAVVVQGTYESCGEADYVIALDCAPDCIPVGCGSPLAGSCFESHLTPFCNDQDCCERMCAIDPTCCAYSWDFNCAQAADCVCDAPPPNDACADAITIGEGVFGAELCGAYSELPVAFDCPPSGGLPYFIQDVWFRYVPTRSGIATISLCGGWAQNVRLAVYVDQGCEALGEPIFCSTNDLCGSDAFCLSVAPDSSYLLRLGRTDVFLYYLDPPDWEQLRIDVAEACDPLASCPNQMHDCITGGTPGCADESCCSLVCALDPWCCEVSWSASCVDHAWLVCGYRDCEVAPPPGLPVIEEAEPCGAHLTGGCDDPTGPISPGVVMHGTIDEDETGGDLDSYTFTITQSSEVSLFVATAVNGVISFNSIDCDTFFLYTATHSCATSCLAECLERGTYVAEVYGTFESLEFPCGGAAANDYYLWIEVNPTCAPPVNDDCGAAILVADGTWEFDMVLATQDGPSIDWPCATWWIAAYFLQDIWYRYEAPRTGTLTVDLCESAFDTRLAVYEGFSCEGLAERLVACNDDACGVRSKVELAVECGDELLIRLGGWSDGGVMNVHCDGARCGVVGDLDGDGAVDASDLAILLGAWGRCPAPCPADLTGDGAVDAMDLAIVLGAWSAG